MAHSPSHRSTHSTSSPNLQPPSSAPAQKQQRRMTSPASNSSLALPEGHRQQPARPPSPLRNEFIPDTYTGIDPDGDSDDSDDDFHQRGRWAERSPSPASSVSQLATSFAQRVGSLVSNIAPRSPGSMPTSAELEAEAERERDRSRREAEQILTREAQERKLVEERVLAMMDSTRALPPPPSRSQTLSNPPSPSNSQKESTTWWAAAKNKLTPTKDKEPLTPAQQVILDAKIRDKGKGKGKDKDKEKEWPTNAQSKYNNPALSNLNIPVAPPQRKPVPTQSTPPSSPTPSRPNLSNLPPNLTPSPMRSSDAISSPSREAPPLYAQFNAQGTLDVAGTLLTIAKRFEKLEKWTVGHVRALEERMSDVERWLVDKEKEKEETASLSEGPEASRSSPAVQHLQNIRDDVSELQGRVGELGREMAKLAAAPSNPSSVPARQPASAPTPPRTTSSIAAYSDPPTPAQAATTTPHHTRPVSATARESTSPPMASVKPSSRTRLPYPAGDYYASPPDTSVLSQGTFSPTRSPSSSITSATAARSLSTAGTGLGISSVPPPPSFSSSSSPALPGPARAVSPRTRGLPPPKSATARPSSVSPTPRKRYTVALGGPIVAPPELGAERTSLSRPPSSIGTAFFSSSPGGLDDDDDDDGDGDGDGTRDGNKANANGEESDFQDETIGKSAAAKFRTAVVATTTASNESGDYRKYTSKPVSPSPSPSSARRLRAQSAYGFSNILQTSQQAPVTPLKNRLRARSIDRGAGLAGTAGDGNAVGGGVGGGKFVDPLVLRRQDREGTRSGMPKPVGKVPIGQLVAFFDGEKEKA